MPTPDNVSAVMYSAETSVRLTTVSPGSTALHRSSAGSQWLKSRVLASQAEEMAPASQIYVLNIPEITLGRPAGFLK